MAKLRKEILIHAPLGRVFAFMLDPHHLPQIWPSMVEVRNVNPKPGGGYKFDWVYKMAGVKIEGGSDTTEFIPDKRVITESTRGIESRFVWEYEPRDGDTCLMVEIEYKIPIPLVGKLAESMIIKQNEREAEILLANLKNRMEVEAHAPL